MLINYIFRILMILIGAWDISKTIQYYEQGHYYACGVMCMMAIYMAIYLFKLSMET